MKKQRNVIIIGTGTLALNILLALSLYKNDEPFNVIIVGRSQQKLDKILTILKIRCYCQHNKQTFHAVCIPLFHTSAFIKLFNTYEPEIVLLCCSLQSPWNPPTAQWQTLMYRFGFGITLPLQAYFAVMVGYALKEYGRKCLYLNACYPDVTNYVLKCHDINVFSGIGNINIISTFLSEKLKTNDFKIIAHHYHLSQSIKKAKEKKQYFILHKDNLISRDLSTILPLLKIKNSDMNQITGAISATLLIKLLFEKSFTTHLPGPQGLLGGYPVKICHQKISLNINNKSLLKKAASLNERWTKNESVQIRLGKILFSTALEQSFKKMGFSFYQGYEINNIINISNEIQDYLRVFDDR